MSAVPTLSIKLDSACLESKSNLLHNCRIVTIDRAARFVESATDKLTIL